MPYNLEWQAAGVVTPVNDIVDTFYDLTELQPATPHAFRVQKDDGLWSSWHEFLTNASTVSFNLIEGVALDTTSLNTKVGILPGFSESVAVNAGVTLVKIGKFVAEETVFISVSTVSSPYFEFTVDETVQIGEFAVQQKISSYTISESVQIAVNSYRTQILPVLMLPSIDIGPRLLESTEIPQ